MPYSLYIITYTRGVHPVTGQVQPYHWSYFLLRDPEDGKKPGTEFQLRGMPGAFSYDGPEPAKLGDLQNVKEVLEIGQVLEYDKSIHAIDTVLKDVEIDRREYSGWNCQDWVLEGLEKLRRKGWVEDVYTADVLKTWLKET